MRALMLLAIALAACGSTVEREQPLACGDGSAYFNCGRDPGAVHACDGSECTCESARQPLISCPEQQPCSALQQPSDASGCGADTYLICPPGAEPPKGSTVGADQQIWCSPVAAPACPAVPTDGPLSCVQDFTFAAGNWDCNRMPTACDEQAISMVCQQDSAVARCQWVTR